MKNKNSSSGNQDLENNTHHLFRSKRKNKMDNFNSLFGINKTEKQRVLKIVEKKKISFFLFYTDYRNIKNILKNGICQLKNIKLNDDETYYVWSYLQHEEAVDLEFDISSRAYFWKWAADANIKLENLCIIGIDPIALDQQTPNDWVFDTSLNLVSLHESIPPESIRWIMIRKEAPLKNIEKMVEIKNLDINVYLGSNAEIKRLNPKKKSKTKSKEVITKGETTNE